MTKVKPKIQWKEVGERLLITLVCLVGLALGVGAVVGLLLLLSLIPGFEWVFFGLAIAAIAWILFEGIYYLLHGHEFENRKYYTYDNGE